MRHTAHAPTFRSSCPGCGCGSGSVVGLSGWPWRSGLRRALADDRRSCSGDGQRTVEPGPAGGVDRSAMPSLQLAADLAERAEALGDDVVLVDRLEVHLRGLTNAGSLSAGNASTTPRIISRTQSSTNRGRRCAFSTTTPRPSASSARRSPTTSTCSTICEQCRPRRSRRRTARCSRCGASRVRAGCGSPPGPPRGSSRCPRRRSPGSLEARARVPATSSCAHGHAVMPWAVTPISRRVPNSVHAAEPWSVYSSCVFMPEIGAGLCSGKRASIAHLRPARLLTRAHELRDVLGERLGLERRLAEDDLADRVVHDLLEPRHVRALLVGAELDHALEPRREQLLAAVLPNPDHLLDVGHADAREAQLNRRPAGLNVDCRDARRGIGGHRVAYRVESAARRPVSSWTGEWARCDWRAGEMRPGSPRDATGVLGRCDWRRPHP